MRNFGYILLLAVLIGYFGGQVSGFDFADWFTTNITENKRENMAAKGDLLDNIEKNALESHKNEEKKKFGFSSGQKQIKNYKVAAYEAFAQDKYHQAASMANHALAQSPKSADMLELLGEIHLRLGNADKLKAHVAYMIDHFPQEEATKYLAFREKLVLRDFSSALQIVRSMGELPPEYRFYRGVLMAMLNDHAAAFDDFKQVADETTSPTTKNKADRLVRSYSDYDFAQEAKDPYRFTLLAKALAEQNEFAVSVALADIAIAENPDYTDAWVVRGYGYLMMEQEQRAIKDLTRAHGQDESRAEVAYLLGMAYQKLTKYDNAISFLEIANAQKSVYQKEVREALLALYQQTNNYEKFNRIKKQMLDDAGA